MSNETTNVVGYFNSNDYPMQLLVSEHNLTLHLPPKGWVVDRAKRVVNDPILDKYVGRGRLSRASNPNAKVPVVRIQAVNAVTPQGQPPTQYQHPVYSATGFQRDANGVMSAVRPQETAPQPSVPPPVSYNPVRAMSVEQARKLRLIKPTRPVSEDDGIPDTAGVPIPGEKTPPIKYAVDTTRDPAPAQVVTAAPMTPEQATLVENMKVAQTLDPESPDFADKAATLAVQRASGVVAPSSIPAPPPPSSNPLLTRLTRNPATAALVAPMLPVDPEPTPMTSADLPDPVLTPEPTPPPSQPPLVVETEFGVSPESSTVVQAPKEGPATTPLTCPLCPKLKPFSSSGYLMRHINRFHGDRAPALLSQLGLV
jgi:hypothetical protein